MNEDEAESIRAIVMEVRASMAGLTEEECLLILLDEVEAIIAQNAIHPPTPTKWNRHPVEFPLAVRDFFANRLKELTANRLNDLRN